jgi:hypothetical protein
MQPAYLLVLAEIFFGPEDGGDMFLRNVITTAVKTSNPTVFEELHNLCCSPQHVYGNQELEQR